MKADLRSPRLRHTPFGVIARYLQMERFDYAGAHTREILRLLKEEGYKLVPLEAVE